MSSEPAPFGLDQSPDLPPVIQRFAEPLEQLLGLDRLNKVYAAIGPQPTSHAFLHAVQQALGVRAVVAPADLARIPASGPLIIVANHPFGAVEGLLLADLLLRVRSDVKILANALLQRIPELRELFAFVDPFGNEHSVRSNLRGLRESLSHLREGGVLGVFPAGEVSHVHLRPPRVTDSTWSETVARLVRRSGATVVPVYFDGANGALFQLAGLVHPLLRTALLPRELLNKHRRPISVCIGNPIAPRRIAAIGNDRDLTLYLRQRTYALVSRPSAMLHPRLLPRLPHHQQSVAPPVPTCDLCAEIARIPDTQRLVDHHEFAVYHATAAQIPHLLAEIGRLREIAFRATGEGTGKRLDLDRYDETYHHLFIWQRSTNAVIGAYRLGLTDEIGPRQGVRGLYTHVLFDYTDDFIAQLGPAIELGRSFVRLEHQRSFAPLLLLWRGIGQFVMCQPRYRTLFGPVSISSSYTSAARELIAAFLRTQHGEPQQRVRPRHPLRARPFRPWSPHVLSCMADDIEHLDELVRDIEGDAKGVPVLVKQYLKLGARVLAFNVDHSFRDALDALIVTDLTKTDDRTLGRYVRADQLAAFRAFQR